MRMLPFACMPPMRMAASTAGTTPAGAPALGRANPASAYCAHRGGKVEIRREAKGEVGSCHLPDSRLAKEWSLHRAEAGARS